MRNFELMLVAHSSRIFQKKNLLGFKNMCSWSYKLFGFGQTYMKGVLCFRFYPNLGSFL